MPDPRQLGRHLRAPDRGVVASCDGAEPVWDTEARERLVEGDVLAEEVVGASRVEGRRDRLPSERGREARDGEQRRAGPPGRRALRPVDVGRVGYEVARPARGDAERAGVAERDDCASP